MLRFFYNVHETLFNLVRKAVLGESIVNYLPHSEEVRSSVKDLYNLQIPGIRKDREGLRQDGRAVLKDYRKAFEKKKRNIDPN